MRTLLEDGPGARATGGAAQLVPADARMARAIRVDGVIEHERLVITEVAILEASHRPRRQRFESDARSGLWDAGGEEAKPA